MEIWIARHGLTQFNVDRRIMGCRNDEPLLPQGIVQANELAVSLPRDFQRIFCSPLKRALQTAQCIANLHQIPLEIRAGLAERDSGILSGKTWAEVGEFTKGAITHDKLERDQEIDFSPYEGQTILQVRDQLNTVFDELREKYVHEKVLLVTHGGNIRVIYAMLKPGEPFVLHNTSLHQFTI